MARKELSRRSFLKGAAVTSAFAASAAVMQGCSPSGESDSGSGSTEAGRDTTVDASVIDQKWSFEIPDDPITDIAETLEADLVVVGAGTSGLITAWSAMEEGLDVIVVSASSKPISRGGSNHAVYSKAMEALGMDREPIRCIQKEIFCNYSAVDTAKWFRFYENSETAMNWLIDIMEDAGYKTGIETTSGMDEDSLYFQHYGAHGWYKDEKDVIGATQPYVVNTLADKITDGGGQIFFKNIGRQLVRGGAPNGTDGRVEGVICEREDGTYAQYNGTKAVVLATGDFSANRDMMAKYAPHAVKRVADEVYDNVDYDKEFVFTGLYPGDGQKMGLWVGAAWQKTYPNCVMGNFGTLSGPPCRSYGGFWGLQVNRNGERFMNEYTMMIPGALTASRQPGGESNAIWDTAYAEHPDWQPNQGGVGLIEMMTPEEVIASWEDKVADGTYVKADTIEELIDALELPADTAKATIDRYNELCEAGKDEDFDKDPGEMYPIATAPFYGQKNNDSKGDILTILGGLRTNAYMRVCDADDNPLEGLYNVGTMVGDFYAGFYSFQEEGINYGACCGCFGYLTGKYIAENE